MKNVLKITIFSLAVFVLAFLVWYSPVLFKGYVLWGGGPTLARNLAQSGVYGAENELNVLLASSQVKEQAQVSASGNKLTTLIYAEIFKKWGTFDENQLILFSSAMSALALVIFALTVFYLFGFKISAVFSLVYIFLPFNWQLPHGISMYEFALPFLAIFFWFYFWGKERKRFYVYLLISGVFLALAGLAREALLLFVPFFFVYLWFSKRRRQLLYIAVPFAILFFSFWGPNAYWLLFSTNLPDELKSAESGFYAHIFPDPYTYHFNKDEFLTNLQSQIDSSQTSFFTKMSLIKAATNNGFMTAGLGERIGVGIVLFSNHLTRFFSLEDVGGPFIFLLMVFGICVLKQRNREFWAISLGWILTTLFLLSFVAMAGRRHLMDFGWILALWISLGVAALADKIAGQFKSKIMLPALLLVVLYALVLANHVAWDNLYESHETDALKILAYSQEIEKLGIQDRDVIAVPDTNLQRLNYLNDKSLVVFRKETVEKLLAEEKLSSAFEAFGVKYIVGYSAEQTKKIVSQTEMTNIADDTIKIAQIPMSAAKSWLLNLVR